MPPAKKKTNKAYQKADVISRGTEITDNIKRCRFRILKELGSGGFGRIYDGIQIKTNGPNESVAIKVEPMINGPLFTEMHVYIRILKLDQLDDWKKQHGVQHLGLPHYISSGSFEYETKQLRYLVIPKYSFPLEPLLKSKRKFTFSEVKNLSQSLLRSLEYLHYKDYTHCDVKAGNIMLTHPTDFSTAVLIDFGLAKLVPKIISEKEDKKKAHNGTPLFTSIDAHRGCTPTFRGDLEILTHNMLYWLLGTLPWEPFDDDNEKIYAAKQGLIRNLDKELPKLLDDNKSKLLIIQFYKIARDTPYASKINIENLLKIIATVEKVERPKSPKKAPPITNASSANNPEQNGDSSTKLATPKRFKRPFIPSNGSMNDDDISKINPKDKATVTDIELDSPSSTVKKLHSTIPGTRNMKSMRRSVVGRALKKH